jgi:hypothetical protein
LCKDWGAVEFQLAFRLTLDPELDCSMLGGTLPLFNAIRFGWSRWKGAARWFPKWVTVVVEESFGRHSA